MELWCRNCEQLTKFLGRHRFSGYEHFELEAKEVQNQHQYDFRLKFLKILEEGTESSIHEAFCTVCDADYGEDEIIKMITESRQDS